MLMNGLGMETKYSLGKENVKDRREGRGKVIPSQICLIYWFVISRAEEYANLKLP